MENFKSTKLEFKKGAKRESYMSFYDMLQDLTNECLIAIFKAQEFTKANQGVAILEQLEENGVNCEELYNL